MKLNSYPCRSGADLILPFVDGLLILGAIFIGIALRLGDEAHFVFPGNFWLGKVMLIVLAIQASMYYFDLYDLRILRERKKMGIILLSSLVVASIFLAFVYYVIPSLVIGRGIFVIALVMTLLMTYFWRLIYPLVIRNGVFRERVLIVGTGELAKRIAREIHENGEGSFEIIGFVEERKE